MITFMNMVKRSLEVGGTKGGVEASGGVGPSVRVLLLLALDFFAEHWAPASSSSSPVGLTKVLTQKSGKLKILEPLQRFDCDIVYLNGLVDLLGMELLEL